MLAGGLALALALALIAPLAIEPAIVLALGERFSGASAPLALMRWALPAFVVSGVAGVLLRAQGEDRPLVIVAAVGAAISLLFNLLLIPAHGALGAATSTLLAELTMALLAAGLVWRRHRGLWRPLLIGGLAGSLAGLSGLIGAGLAPDSWWLATGLAAGLAGGLLGATGGLWMIVRRRSDRLGV
jgi:O-antigen/teichoic acid export membrane protein